MYGRSVDTSSESTPIERNSPVSDSYSPRPVAANASRILATDRGSGRAAKGAPDGRLERRVHERKKELGVDGLEVPAFDLGRRLFDDRHQERFGGPFFA